MGIRGSLMAAAAATAILGASNTAAQMPSSITPADIRVESGTLRGDNQNGVLVFRGVPFAAPPVGDLRWKAPRKVDAWSGIRMATAHEPPCPQPTDEDPMVLNFGGVNGAQSEDCLYLTLFAPQKAAKAPVVVWFHGGAFFLGGGHLGSYDGSANARKGVVTVGVNYRLGALANMVHPALDAEAPGQPSGNYALHDAVAALRWVRANIAAFGGDPDNITIAGQSAGGGIVVSLLSLPSAKGLFAKAIVQSGALLIPDVDRDAVSKKAVAALEAIGIGADASVDTLRGISAQTLVSAPGTQRGWYFTKDDSFNPNSTITALRAGTEFDVPVLVGSNSGERGFSAARTLAQLAGDSGAPAFLYQFDHVPAFRKPEWTKGPIHSAELMFTFSSIPTSVWGGAKADSQDQKVADTINDCWVAFYKQAPGARAIDCGKGFRWDHYGAASQAAIFATDAPRLADATTMPDGPEGVTAP